MRSIQLRVWDKELQEMTEVFQIEWENGSIKTINGSFVLAGYPLMQCTGFKDKNGKKIYGKDIVKGFKSFHGKFVVAFEDGSWMCKHKGGDIYLSVEIPQLEIIGNTIDNPELVEAK